MTVSDACYESVRVTTISGSQTFWEFRVFEIMSSLPDDVAAQKQKKEKFLRPLNSIEPLKERHSSTASALHSELLPRIPASLSSHSSIRKSNSLRFPTATLSIPVSQRPILTSLSRRHEHELLFLLRIPPSLVDHWPQKFQPGSLILALDQTRASPAQSEAFESFVHHSLRKFCSPGMTSAACLLALID
ncbi:hypothetical protein AXG93_2587s1120 [Marchantia polymorpha subsp. ruderalis]|uniref:Uncharacterized protein n=1 Tax=Marchantia polymorpha subsp. ruderalis TaxID=1480154 RepID=A0A176WQK7_MARPO|nr:hypothetical protein AXG93_2587s1120 [Marchantia polymorpha subsp. ruderalis]